MMKTQVFKLLLAFTLTFAVVPFDNKVPSFGSLAYGQETSQNETESYFIRPNIYDVKPESHELSADWPQMRKSHFHMIAFFLELYPNTDLYFLARDSELLYDAAKLITRGTPDESRMHLLNISRLNMHDTNIKNYLAQEGITENSLASGRRAIFIDTGFAGSISAAVAKNFSTAAAKKIKTHLIVSNNAAHPSARSFLYYLDPEKALADTQEMHRRIVTYEHLPRYTDRSTQFVYKQGRFHPMSAASNGKSDGTVSKDKALQHMQDLKAFWNLPTTPGKVKEVRQFTRSLIDYIKTTDVSVSGPALKARLETQQNKELLQALLRDIIDAKGNMTEKIALTLQDLGIKKFDSRDVVKEDPIEKLAAKHPKFAKIILNPAEELETLFENKDYKTITEVVKLAGTSTNLEEIDSRISENLFEGAETGDRRKLQLDLLNVMEPRQIVSMAMGSFTDGNMDEVGYLFEKILATGNAKAIDILAGSEFDGVKNEKWKSILEKMVDKTSQQGLGLLFEVFFAKDISKKYPELFDRAVARASKPTMIVALKNSFSGEKAMAFRPTLIKIIDRSDKEVLSNVFNNILEDSSTFRKDYELYRYAISKVPDGQHRFLEISYPSSIEKRLRTEELVQITSKAKRIEFLNQRSVFKDLAAPKSCKMSHL